MNLYSKPLVFTDFHHSSLLYSFILLFERRLGGSVFRPIGRDWYEKGFWKYSDSPGIIKQYLEIDDGGYKASPLNINSSNSTGIYLCQDQGFTNKAITLDNFYNIPFDIVIATIPEHIKTYERLCNIHPNKPKLIYQIGNPWIVEDGLVPNIMASALINRIPKNTNFVYYHQEFDLTIFKPDFSYPDQKIFSFVNCFSSSQGYSSEWKLFETVEKLMPDWSFKSFGGLCRDGNANGPKELAQRMKDSRFIWNVKKGEGYGHIIYNSAAVARPMIVKMEYYHDKLGKELMIDGKTCIVIDGLTPQEIINKILYYSDQNRYATLCKNIYNNFKEKVNFDHEEKMIRTFLQNLK